MFDFQECGYAREAVIPEYFGQGEHAIYMAKYFSAEREKRVDQEKVHAAGGYAHRFQYRTGPFTRDEHAVLQARLYLWRYTGQQHQYCPRD